MSIEQRRHIRFSLDIPATRCAADGARAPIMLHQISIGGCLTEWDDAVFTGDEFRLEFNLPNGNRFPLLCKALYKFPGKGIGAKFVEITEFEQELLGKVISDFLEKEGLPMQVDPFAMPPGYVGRRSAQEQIPDKRFDEEKIVEEILSLEN